MNNPETKLEEFNEIIGNETEKNTIYLFYFKTY